MKKSLIALAIAGVIGVGGFAAYNKADDIANQQITQFIKAHKNEPIVITNLQASPMIDTAQWVIKQSDDTNIESVLTLHFAGEETPLNIPLSSKIIRRKAEYNGNSYGFGKIVTKPDLSAFSTDLPVSINNETFISTQYIGLNGEVLSVDKVSSITDDKFTFDGLTSETKTSLLDTENLTSKITIGKLTVSDDGSNLQLSPSNWTTQMNANHEYTATSTPFSISIQEDTDSTMVLKFGNGRYNGSYQYINGLTPPISDTTIIYDTTTVVVDELILPFKNLNIAAGSEVANNQTLNITSSISTDIDEKMLATGDGLTAMSITPLRANLSYQFNSVPYALINRYYQATVNAAENNVSSELDNIFSQEDGTAMLTSLQSSDASFVANANFEAEEGKATLTAGANLNETGKTLPVATTPEVIDELLPKIIDADVQITIDETLANATELSMLLQFMLGVTPEEGKYNINAKLKDGITTVNGQEM